MPEGGRTAARFDKRGIAFCAIAGALLLTAGAARATSSHDPWKLKEVRVDAVPTADAMGQCENCHTLDVAEGEPNTSYVNRNAKTLPQMRAFGGVPVSFGCTFCHTTVTDNIYMRNALKDYEFTVAARKHPVGVTVGGVENTNEYFSTFDSTAQVDQLQCMDCHDATLLNPGGMGSYPYHEGRTTDAAPWTGTWNKAVNPYGLKNVAALGDERGNHCVNTCHGNLGAANGATKPRMGHLGWGGYNGTTMYEPRGQAMLQSNCGVCHDVHSSTKDRLMSDGLASQTTGVNPAPPPDLLKTPETAIDMNDCTLVCHVGRNAASEFRTLGHGKLRNREDTANIGHSYTICTPCHTSSVPHRDPANPKRFSFTEGTAMAVLSHNGSANGLDDDYDGQVDEADEATWTQPQVSICQGCHTEYYAHSGAITGAVPSNQSASCLDCHDPHGKGVGANIEMIRTTIAGEATTFQNTADMAGADDFYRGLADRSGVCDNVACHGRDLAAILADTNINDHTGVQAGDNCTGCHTHKSPVPAPSFRPQCDICHGYPPANGGLPDYSQGIGVHERHVTNLAISCEECHYRNAAAGNAHNEAAWSEPTGIPVPRTHIDVVFNTHGGTVNMNATYSGYSGGNMDSTIGAVHTCDNVTCHNPDSSTAGTGLTGKAGAATNNVVSWADAFTPINACTGCHVQSPASNPDGGSHYKHDNSTGGKGFPCQMCHSPYYDATDTFGTAAGAHGNWALNATGVVNINGTLGAQAVGGTFDDATNACSNVYCHGTTLGAGGDQPAPVWGPGVLRSGGLCGDCHDTDPGTDVTAPSATISTGNHTAHLGAPQGPNITCTGCHPAYALNAANHVDGEKDFLNVDDTTVTTMTLTDTCTNCHGTSVANAKNATNWATGTFRLGCLECHDGSARSARIGGVIAPQENLYWTTTGHGRPGTTYNATLHGQPGPGYLCSVCHNEDAPHISGALGDSERFRAVADDALDYTSDTSEVCLDCHKVGQAVAPPPVNHLGRDAQAEASVHSGALTGNYNTAAKAAVAFPVYGNAAGYAASPGYQCEACHNPHGTTKLAMVKDSLNGLLGIPADNNPVAVGAAFDSSSATLAGLDPTLGVNDGACDACHRSSVNTNAHPDSASGKANNHNYGQICVNCHDHKNSFFAGCADCHGGSQVGATRSNYWPDGVAGPNTAGAHAGHVADLAMRIYGQTVAQLLDDPASDARQKHLCKYCHGLSPGNDADHGVTANLPAEVGASLGRLWDTADPPALTDAVTYNAPAGSRTCQTSECHYNTTTPGWLSGLAATCTTCHNNGTNNGALANSWPDVGAAGTGDHFAHYAALGAEFTAVYGANNVCLACHNTQQPATDFSNIVSLASHIDGDRYGDVTIPVAFNDKSEGTTDTVGYTAGVTPNENNGTCANVSCHGGSTIGATPAWRDGTITTTTVTTVECAKCHQRVDGATNPLGTEYNDARSGAHVDHDHGCQACHSAVPTAHFAGIATSALDNPDSIGNVTYSVEYTDTTAAAVNPLTNGWFNDATTAFGVSGTCATVTCHAGASPAWDVDLTASCGLCHLDSPVSNSHAAHVTAGATPDHTDCDQCHTSAAYAVAATGTDTNFLSPGLHADGTVNLVAGIGATGSGGAVACATACHARETTTTWDNTTVPMACNSCHYYAAAPAAAGNVGIAALGGTHNAHFFGAPANIVCTDCHADNGADVNDKRTHMRNTGANDGAVLQNKAAAFQDEADVTIAALGPTGTDPDMAPIGADLTSNPTCNTVLCHNPSPGAAYSATWNGAPNGSCGFCHADTTGDPASGSHTKHIAYAAGYAPCVQCHVDNGTTYTHLDRNVDLVVSLTYSASLNPPYDNTSWGSCSAGACHDTDLDPAWGTAVPANSCGVCHVNNNAAPVSSSDSPNFAGSDRVASQVGVGDEWTLRGHAARGLICTSCHDGAANSHQPDLATSTNPFRLGPGYTTPDAFCSNTTTCHTGATVPGSNLVTSHTNELMNLDQRTWPAWDPKCVDCHDPHGDLANLKMVATDVFDRGSSTHGVPTATLNAIPRTADVVDFTVQGGIAVGSYGDTTAGADGICQECHLANDGVATGIVSFQDDNTVALAGNHPTTSLSPCTQCHKHDKAFEPAGCYGCHGNAPAKRYWPDGVGGSPAYVDDSVGAHDNHVLAISQWLGYGDIATLLAAADTDVKQKTICSFCHPDPGGNGHSTNNGSGDHASTVDVWFDGMNNGGGAGNNFKAFKIVAGTYGDDAGAAQATYNNAAAAKACSNVDCHNEYVTPVGWNSPPDWSALAPNGRCSNFSCHDPGSYSIAHTAHVADKLAVTAGNGYLCTECHVDNGVNYRHQNGRVDMLFTLAGTIDVQFGGGTIAYYDKDNGGTSSAGDTGFAYKDGVYARSCYNLYCHGADSTWSGADTTPVWNTPNTATCYGASTCHNAYGSPYDQGGVARNAITSGSHEVHMTQWTSAVGVEAANPVGPRMSPHPNSLAGSSQHSCDACHNISQGVCTDCHNGITGSGASLPTLTHVDGRVDFTGTITGPSPFSVTAASLAATDACNECHGGAAGAATAKGNWLSGTALACESCHGDNTAARSRRNIGWPAEASVDAPLRAGAVFDTSGHGKVTDNVTYGGSACVHCHNEVSQHFTQRTNTIAPALGDTNRLDVLGGNDYGSVPTAFCGTCHSGVVETVHYTNLRTAGGSSDDANQCAICHDPHGQAGQDAMVNGTIAGRSVTGFADKSVAGSYFNGTNTGVCQVCHDPLEVQFHNRTSGAASTHSPNEVCTTCHKHEATVAFEPRSCESCHNGATPYVKGTATAPNVMGNGTSATGTGGATPKPYDDGSYGFNVNGHGRDDTPSVPGNPINVACTACHDINVPTGTHVDGVLNGRLSPDTRNANSFHLLSAFVKAAPISEHDVQVTFDNACYSTCHSVATSDMRHALDAVPAVNAAQFGTHNSYQDPQNTPPPTMYYDKHLKTNAAYDGLPNFALCVSCHNPHGTNTTSPRADLNNKMVLYQWASPAVLCAQCHP